MNNRPCRRIQIKVCRVFLGNYIVILRSPPVNLSTFHRGARPSAQVIKVWIRKSIARRHPTSTDHPCERRIPSHLYRRARLIAIAYYLRALDNLELLPIAGASDASGGVSIHVSIDERGIACRLGTISLGTSQGDIGLQLLVTEQEFPMASSVVVQLVRLYDEELIFPRVVREYWAASDIARLGTPATEFVDEESHIFDARLLPNFQHTHIQQL